MTIQNSTITSSARRLYQSAHSIYHEKSEWDNATGESVTETTSETTQVTEYSTSSNGVETNEPLPLYDTSSDSSLSASENSNEGNSTIKQEMKQLMERFHSFHAYTMPSAREMVKDIQEIQRESMTYLIRLLFGEDTPKSLKNLSNSSNTGTPIELSSNHPVRLVLVQFT